MCTVDIAITAIITTSIWVHSPIGRMGQGVSSSVAFSKCWGHFHWNGIWSGNRCYINNWSRVTPAFLCLKFRQVLRVFLFQLNVSELQVTFRKCGYKLVTFIKQKVRQKAAGFITTWFNGVNDGARTRDNRNHNPGLYQLSYAHHNMGYSANGALGRTRTCDPRLRRPVLYPVELQALNWSG